MDRRNESSLKIPGAYGATHDNEGNGKRNYVFFFIILTFGLLAKVHRSDWTLTVIIVSGDREKKQASVYLACIARLYSHDVSEAGRFGEQAIIGKNGAI